MSMFDRSSDEDEQQRVEEAYKESIYPQAMKDFIHIDDFRRIMKQLMRELRIDEGAINLDSMTSAKARLKRYNIDLEQGDE